MAEPQAFSFWAPPTPALDASPIMRGAEVSAAGMLAAGQAIGEGIKEGRKRADEQEKIKKQEEASKEISSIMEEFANPKNSRTEQVETWTKDPGLAGLDKPAARVKIVGWLTARGVPQDVAEKRAIRATSAQTVRIYNSDFEPRLRAMAARAQTLASRAGMDPNVVGAAIRLSMEDVYPDALSAENAAMDAYMNILAPPEEVRSTVDFALRGQAEREKESFAREMSDKAFRESRLNAETAWGRTQEELKIRSKLVSDEANQDVTRKAQLMFMENAYAKERIAYQNRLEEGTRVKLQEMENTSRREVAQLRDSGMMGDAEVKSFDEFNSVASNAITFGQVMDVPLTDVPAILGGTGLDSIVGKTEANEIAFITGSGKVGKANDYRGVFAYLGTDGEVHLKDIREEGAIPQEQLDKAARKLFANEKAKFAVVMQMVYGGHKVDKTDLDNLYRVNNMARKLGGDGILDRTAELIIQAQKDKNRSGFISPDGKVVGGTATGADLWGGGK